MNNRNQHKNTERNGSSHGAVAVFIAIILVPCIVVASIFVDVSRVQYSKMEATSAADLALDAALAGYDRILSDYYGLVASCQDSDEFLKKSEEYFTGMMRAEGNDTGADIFTEFIKQYKNGTTADFLKTDIVDSVKAEPVTKSNLEENPALIEDGIVEFMKYRGLVPLGKRLKDFGERVLKIDGFEQLADAEGNKDVAKAKEEYGEAESQLLKDAFHTYLAIRIYEEAQLGTDFPSADGYRDISATLKEIRNDLYDVTELITLYYAGTDGINYVNFPSIGQNEYTSDPRYTKAGVGSAYVINGETVYYIYKSTYDDLIKLVEGEDCELARYENAIKEAADRVVSSCEGITYNNGTTNPAIWCYKIQQAIDSTDLNTIGTYADSIMILRARLKGAMECQPDPTVTGDAALPSDWKNRLQFAYNTIGVIWQDYLRQGDFDYGDGSYNSLRKQYNYVANEMRTIEKVWNRSYTFDSFFGENVTIDSFASQATGYINSRIGLIDERIAQLDKAIDGGTITWKGKDYNAVSLDTLKDEADNKAKKLGEWEDLADLHSDSQYVQQVDKPQIEKIKANAEGEATPGDSDPDAEANALEQKIDGESVEELKLRLVHIRDDLQKCKDSIDNFTYGGKKIHEIHDVGSYIDAGIQGGIDKDQIGLSLTEGRTKAQEFARSLIKPSEGEVFQFTGFETDESGSEPRIRDMIPRLYKYLSDHFRSQEDEIGQNTEDAEKKLDEFKDKMNEAADFAKIGKMDAIAESECGKDKIEDISTTETGNILSALGSFITYTTQIINGDGGVVLGNARDKVYVTEYVMDMLTYATTNNEGRYKQNESATFKDYDQKYNVSEWGNTDAIKVPEDQSLTNKCFNLENNKALLGEVEYILYGKETVQENAAEAYYKIFLLREALDLTSGFILFWSPVKTSTGGVINTMASSIAAATAGCIPALLSKTVMITALATIEAGKDVEYLKKGVGVTFYKTKEEHWLCALSGASWKDADIDSDGIGKTQPEDREGIYYSDYLYIFFLLATQDDTAYNNMLLRLGDIIENNMGLHSSGFDLKNSYCYYRLSATMQVKPLMLSMPIIDSYNEVDVKTFRNSSVWCQYKVDAVRGYS